MDELSFNFSADKALSRTSLTCESVFFFNDPPTPEIYTLSLHDALPILPSRHGCGGHCSRFGSVWGHDPRPTPRSEEHTSELQSHSDLVCRLLLEKKKVFIPIKTRTETPSGNDAFVSARESDAAGRTAPT